MIPKYFAVGLQSDEDNKPFIEWFTKNYSSISGFYNLPYYYGINKNSMAIVDKKDNNRWHPDTQFFESAEEFMKLVNNTPKRTRDSIQKNEVIHCPTQEEWDAITKLFDISWPSETEWEFYKEKSCINPNSHIYSPLNYYKSDNRTITSASDFLTPNTKQMNNIISREGMEEIYNIACSTWKKKIESWTKPFGNTILTQAQVDEMYSAADEDQKKVLDKYLKRELTLDDIRGMKNHFKKDENDFNYMIGVRNQGEYNNKGYYLHNHFNWELKKDNNGLTCLIPTPKS